MLANLRRRGHGIDGEVSTFHHDAIYDLERRYLFLVSLECTFVLVIEHLLHDVLSNIIQDTLQDRCEVTFYLYRSAHRSVS